jgi:beta-phosphoglucomutase-like phosphatase (HAD superfamily)
MGEIRLFPGVADLLAALAALVPLGIGSGGRAAEIDFVLRANGARDRFACIVSADDVHRSKPDPDCFLKAMEELRARAPALGGRLEPAECLVVEDAPPGIEAARAAGMPCLAVAHTFPPEALAGAARVAARLGDITAADLLG